MNLTEAQVLAESLIAEYAPTYRFRWDNARTRFGQCNYTDRIISLSRPVTRMTDIVEVRDTILHECAHAIAGASAGHGSVWRYHALRIGGTGNRTAHVPNVRDEAPWIGVCPNGHESAQRFFRKPRNPRSCGQCRPGRYDARYILEYRHVDSLVGMR